MYGSVTLQQDMTIPNTHRLGIPAFNALTIPGDVTLTNNGTIVVYQGGVINGTVAGNQPVASDLTISGGSSYTYAGGLLTVTGNGTYTIGMKSGLSATTTDRITVASGVNANITLSAVNIDMSGTNDTAAFDMMDATVQLTLTGTNILKSGGYRPGLQVPEGSTLTISAADETHALTANGGARGAGIGGYYDRTGGTVTINGGTVTATGGQYGAGIGGGMDGAGGTIAELSGNAVVFASSIQPTITAGENATQAIVFIGNTGTMYGNVTLQQDMTIPTNYTLEISPSGVLTIPGGVTLTNNGTIKKYHGGVINGTVAGNQLVDSDLTISGGSSYTYSGGLLTVAGNGTYTIGMKSGLSATTTDRIVIVSGVNANITLSAVNIDMSGNSNITAFDMTGATVQLTLTGTNVLKGGSTRAGLHAPEGSTLTISAADETHALTANGGTWGAGIGGSGDWRGSGGGAGGTVTINGGTVTATGGSYAAGIGGGGYYYYPSDYGAGDGGSVTISGGMVTATGGSSSAGIGGGSRGGAGGTVTISGGTVTATGNGGAGIGGGNGGNAGTIAELSGNAVVFASSIAPTLTAGGNATQAIAFNGNTGTMYGNVTLQQDVTIPNTHTLDLASGQTLTIPGTVTLTNEGTINKNGGTITGSVAGTGTVN
jgi:hypothetical protein